MAEPDGAAVGAAVTDGDASRPRPVHVIDARRPAAGALRPATGFLDPDAAVPIGSISWRQRVVVQGRVRSLRVRPWGEVLTLEVVLVDDTGGVTVVFPGRRRIPGIRPGTLLTVEGMVGARDNRLTVLNPHYDLRPFSR